MIDQTNPSYSPRMSHQSDVVAACQKELSHAWMVRTFIKHSPEAEDFPELMQIVRAVFDLSRALETCLNEPSRYIRMLQKKLPKLRKAVDQFRIHAREASTHTNFEQAVLSISTVLEKLTLLLETALHLPADDIQ